jgi:L-alanine-DL-glutamate epimerase-like enolase superfamily enzyme
VEGISIRFGKIAETVGIPCLMGSQAETGLGTLASAQFGAARKNVSYPSEISYFLNMEDDLLAEPIEMKNGIIYLPKKAGNGAVLDAKKIKKYRLD